MVAGVASVTDGLTDAVDTLAAEPIDRVSAHGLGDDLVAIRRQVDRLEAEFIRRLHRFDRQQGALSEGAASTVSWLRSTCGLTGGAAADRVRMGRVLTDLPQTMTSFRAGRAPFTNISLIARLADDVGVDATRSVEDTLVTAAETVDTARMHYLVAFTRHRLDADGALDKDNRDHDRRWFSCNQTYGGLFILRGELDAEGGAVVKSAIDALSAPAGSADERTGSQTARRIAYDSVRTEATVSDTGSALSVGRAKRTIPAPIRTALGMRDKGCRFPGCDRPPEWTDGHHIRHWSDGGETSLHNLVLLCRRHHRMVHERGWELRLDAAGEVTVEEPRGRPALVRRL